MGARPVPPEILNLILSQLGQDALLEASLAHRTLRAVALPLLFSHFVFHPYTSQQWPNREMMLPSTAKVQLILERIQFWSSETIAPWVRSCEIRPSKGTVRAADSANLPPLTWSSGNQAPTGTRIKDTVLLDAFFEALPLFTGLTRMQISAITINDAMLGTLSRLPLLKALRTDDQCMLRRTGESVQQTLALSGFESLRGSDAAQWLPLLQPELLRKLSLTLPKIPHSFPAFSYLRELHLKLYLDAIRTQLVSLLGNFPSIEKLVLGHFGHVSDSLLVEESSESAPEGLVPALADLTTSSAVLPILFPRRTITRLIIPLCTKHGFTHFLETKIIEPQNNFVTSLSITWRTYDDNGLAWAVFKAFPRLVHLALISKTETLEHDTMRLRNMLDTLPIHEISPALESLAIRYMDLIDHEKYLYYVMEPTLAYAVWRSLLQRCPGLSSLWIEEEETLFYWRKFPDGDVEDLISGSEEIEAFAGDHRAEYFP